MAPVINVVLLTLSQLRYINDILMVKLANDALMAELANHFRGLFPSTNMSCAVCTLMMVQIYRWKIVSEDLIPLCNRALLISSLDVGGGRCGGRSGEEEGEEGVEARLRLINDGWHRQPSCSHKKIMSHFLKSILELVQNSTNSGTKLWTWPKMSKCLEMLRPGNMKFVQLLKYTVGGWVPWNSFYDFGSSFFCVKGFVFPY